MKSGKPSRAGKLRNKNEGFGSAKQSLNSNNTATNLNSKSLFRFSDRFDLARLLLLGMILFTAICFTFHLLGVFLRFDVDETARLVKTLELSDLSVVPSGRRPRAPESAEPSVNLDFSPFLPQYLSDPLFLVIESPESSGKSYRKMQ